MRTALALFLSGVLVGATCMVSMTPPIRCGAAYAGGAIGIVCR